MNQVNDEKLRQEPLFYDYLLMLLKYKWFILISVLAASIASVVISSYIPKVYSATASIMPADMAKSIGVLRSYRVRDVLIEQLGIEGSTVDEARSRFNSMVTIKQIAGGIITITAVDTDPERAAKITNGMVAGLGDFYKTSLTAAGKEARVFAEGRLAETRRALVKADEALLKFKVNNPQLTRVSLSNSASNSAKDFLIKRQVAQTKTTAQERRIEDLKHEIMGLNNMFVGLEVDKMMDKSDLMASPNYSKLMLQFSWLTREAQIQHAVFNVLSSQYQGAKLQEMQYMPSVPVLDSARVPQVKSGPNRALIVEVSVVGAFFLSVFISLFIEVVRKSRGCCAG